MTSESLLPWLRYNAVYRPIASLPHRMAYHSVSCLGRLSSWRQPAARASMTTSLQRLLIGCDGDDAQLGDWIDQHFAMLARETLDVFRISAKRPGRVRDLISVEPDSLRLLRGLEAQGRGVIIAMSHFGRLNLLLVGLAQAGHRLGMLTMAIDGKNPGLNRVQRRFLARKVGTVHRLIGGSWITLNDDMRRLYRVLHEGETMVILFDAFSPERSQHKAHLPFFGGTLTVSNGISRLAHSTGAAVVYGSVHETADYRVVARLRALPEQPDEALASAVAALQSDIRTTPWQWWQWGMLDHMWRVA